MFIYFLDKFSKCKDKSEGRFFKPRLLLFLKFLSDNNGRKYIFESLDKINYLQYIYQTEKINVVSNELLPCQNL